MNHWLLFFQYLLLLIFYNILFNSFHLYFYHVPLISTYNYKIFAVDIDCYALPHMMIIFHKYTALHTLDLVPNFFFCFVPVFLLLSSSPWSRCSLFTSNGTDSEQGDFISHHLDSICPQELSCSSWYPVQLWFVPILPDSSCYLDSILLPYSTTTYNYSRDIIRR